MTQEITFVPNRRNRNTQTVSQHKTAWECFIEASEACDSNVVGKFVETIDSSLRHQWRVEETTEASKQAILAFEQDNEDEIDDLDSNKELNELMVLLMVLDYQGIGGPKGAGGKNCSTVRMPCFSDLGKGRKQALDGQVWMNALKEAIESKLEQFNGQILIRPYVEDASDDGDLESFGLTIEIDGKESETYFDCQEFDGVHQWILSFTKAVIWQLCYEKNIVSTPSPLDSMFEYMVDKKDLRDWSKLYDLLINR